MGIQGYGQFDAFQSNYRVNEIPRIKPQDTIKELEEKQPQVSENLTSNIQIEEVEDKRVINIDPKDVSLSFNKNDDFSYIGKDKDINNLDMEKAISDMKQDSILQEYQYFVGSAKNVFQSQDGLVLHKL